MSPKFVIDMLYCSKILACTHMNSSYECICNSSNRLMQFLDHDTMDNTTGNSKVHVRTIDTKTIPLQRVKRCNDIRIEPYTFAQY